MLNRALLLVLGAAMASATLQAQSSNLRVGAARVDITPSAQDFPFPLTPQGGIMPSFAGVHDQLYARALMLDDGSTQAAIVIVDLAEIPKPALFPGAIAKAIGIPESNLILAASHTHSEPLMYYRENDPRANEVPGQAAQWDKLLDRVISGTVEAAKQAKAKLQPAQAAFTRGQSFVNIHDAVNSSGDPSGYSDKSLDIIRFLGVDGKPIALLLDYGVPGSLMLHNVTQENGAEITGDILGMAAQLIEKQSPDAPVTLFAAGADGDQRPLLRATLPEVGTIPASRKGSGAWYLLDLESRILAQDALTAVAKMQPGSGQVKLFAASKTVTCPASKMLRDPATGKFTSTDGPPARIPLNLIRIGDIAIAGVGGNVGSVIGKKFKEASPLVNSTMLTVTNGSAGYILDDATYANPGGIKTGQIKPGCAENAIIQGLVEMIQSKH